MPTLQPVSGGSTSGVYRRDMRRAGQAGYAAAMGGPAGGGSWFTGPLSASDISAAMNPYLQSVINPMNAQFDSMRAGATNHANQVATGSNAFGGSRHAILEAVQRGQVDNAQGLQIGQLMHSGYGDAVRLAEHNRTLRERQIQEPLFRHQTGLGFMGMAPFGGSTPQGGGPGVLGGAASGAMIGSAILPGWGTAIGAGLGGLWGALS